MELDDLKKIKSGDPTRFVKKRNGYVDWTFDQVVRYRGYDAAVKVVDQYKGYKENCKLRQSYRFFLQEGDCFVIDVATHSIGSIEFIVDLDGFIIDGLQEGAEFREWAQSNKSDIQKVIWRKEYKKDL